jgi:hypothetical protein
LEGEHGDARVELLNATLTEAISFVVSRQFIFQVKITERSHLFHSRNLGSARSTLVAFPSPPIPSNKYGASLGLETPPLVLWPVCPLVIEIAVPYDMTTTTFAEIGGRQIALFAHRPGILVAPVLQVGFNALKMRGVIHYTVLLQELFVDGRHASREEQTQHFDEVLQFLRKFESARNFARYLIVKIANKIPKRTILLWYR